VNRMLIVLLLFAASGCTALAQPTPTNEPTPTLNPALIQPRQVGGKVGLDMAPGQWSFTGAETESYFATCTWFIKNANGEETASYSGDAGGIGYLIEGDTLTTTGCGTWSYLGP